MHTLYQTACRTDSGLAPDALIGRLVRSDAHGPDEVTVRTRMHSAIITVRNAEGTLSLHLLEPRTPPAVPTSTSLPPDASAWHRYTAAEVLAFVDAVGDTNPVHRTAAPIVPAYCLLYDIAAPFVASRYDLRLRCPVRAGEMLYLARHADRIEGYTKRGHVCTLTVTPRKEV